jgi:hypothetical protein
MKPEVALLAKLAERYVEFDGDLREASASFCDIMDEFGMNNRNTGWRRAWAKLIETDKYIEPLTEGAATYTSDFALTLRGLEASDVKRVESTKPSTNSELHDAIKSRCMNKRGEQIFDLLLTKGPLTRKELANKHLMISDRGAYFSYALQQLKDLGFVEVDTMGKSKLRLSDKCFMDPVSDRELFLLPDSQKHSDPIAHA